MSPKQAIFAFVPIGRAQDPRTRHVRIGRCKASKPLRDRFHGLNVPKLVLLDIVVPNADLKLDWLKNVLRGQMPLWGGEEREGPIVCFTSWQDFKQTDYGSKWFETAFPEKALRLFFGEIEKRLMGNPGDGHDVRACLEANRSTLEDVDSNPLPPSNEPKHADRIRRVVPGNGA